MSTRYTVVVVAEHTDDVIVVTPRTLARARGREAHRLVVARPMLTHPQALRTLDAIAPCFAPMGDAAIASWCAGRTAAERAAERLAR